MWSPPRAWLPQKLAAWGETLVAMPRLLRERRAIQDSRAIGAGEFAAALADDLDSPTSAPPRAPERYGSPFVPTGRSSPEFSTPVSDRGGHSRHEGLRLFVDVVPGDVQDSVPMRGQDLVAGAVPLALGLRGVERMTVDLDDQVGLRPEEIDLVAMDAGVDPRLEGFDLRTRARKRRSASDRVNDGRKSGSSSRLSVRTPDRVGRRATTTARTLARVTRFLA